MWENLVYTTNDVEICNIIIEWNENIKTSRYPLFINVEHVTLTK